MNNKSTHVTLKEVYEKVIVLETKLDLTENRDNNTTSIFTRYVIVLAVLSLVNILTTLFVVTLLI